VIKSFVYGFLPRPYYLFISELGKN